MIICNYSPELLTNEIHNSWLIAKLIRGYFEQYSFLYRQILDKHGIKQSFWWLSVICKTYLFLVVVSIVRFFGFVLEIWRFCLILGQNPKIFYKNMCNINWELKIERKSNVSSGDWVVTIFFIQILLSKIIEIELLLEVKNKKNYEGAK